LDLINPAAKALIKRRRGPGWQRQARQKIQLATDVSLKSSASYGRTVTRKWVTQHQAKIEQRRRELLANPEMVSIEL